MEWLDDSKACLDVAQMMLQDIILRINDSVPKEKTDPYLKVSIKNFLENCRSPLDYAANHIFDTYCRNLYSEHELKKFGKPYFPIRYNKHSFDICIRDYFRHLNKKHLDVVNVLERHQSYNSHSNWLKNLTALTNENKHRNLSKGNLKEDGVSVQSITLPNGTVLNNISSFNSQGANIMINGIPFDFNTSKNHPFVKNFNSTFYVSLIFTDLNLPVESTLIDICEGSSTLISELEQVLFSQEASI